LALSRGLCWLRLIDTPEALAPLAARIRERGVELCLRLGLTCRPTREEAIGERERGILASSDSRTMQGALQTADQVGWMNSHLWAGLVPYYGSSAITLLGSPRELCEAFLEYKRIGVTQFIISGWPKLEEMLVFGREVLPLIRDAEREAQ
jgi:alkanesulfonate monooxygenase